MINKVAAILLIATLIGAAIFLPPKAKAEVKPDLYCKSMSGDLFFVSDYAIDGSIVIDLDCGRIFPKEVCLEEIASH